jgi:hypothetical protein
MPILHIMKTILFWSVQGISHCAHFAACSAILAHPLASSMIRNGFHMT